jgi:hypothetical protein
MSNGKLGSPYLNFNENVANIRRNHMVNALMKNDEEGNRILTNVKKHLYAKSLLDENGLPTANFV